MGQLTLAELEAETRQTLDDDQDTASTRVRLWLSWGYDFITRPNVHRHMELETSEDLTIGSSRILTPTITWRQIDYVEHWLSAAPTETTTKRPIRPTRGRELARRGQFPQSQPGYYNYRSRLLYLDKVPDATTALETLRIWGVREPVAMDRTSDSWVTVLPRDWDPILTQAGAWFGWIGKHEMDRATEARAELGRLINEIAEVQDLSAEDTEEPMHVTGTVGMRRSG